MSQFCDLYLKLIDKYFVKTPFFRLYIARIYLARILLIILMKLAVTVWNKRIAPVFDSATTLLILDMDNGECLNSKTVTINTMNLAERSELLKNYQVQELICGAISREAEALVRMYEIGIVSYIAGDLEQVLQAWSSRILYREEFSMPGYGPVRRRHRHGRGRRQGRGI